MKQEERILQPFPVYEVARALAIVFTEASAEMIGRARGKLAHPGIAFLEILLLLHLADKRTEPRWNPAVIIIIAGRLREEEVLQDKSNEAFP